MNIGKCATCDYVNESATAFCSRSDCPLTLRPAYETGYRGRVHCATCGSENATGPEVRAVTGWPLHCGVRMAEGCK